MTDEQVLIRQVQDGDHEAFAELVKRHETNVFNLCLRMSGNREDAMDLSQEAFLKAWRGIRFYKAESAFSTWLYRLTSNVCIDFLRKQKRRPTVSLTMEEDDSSVELEVVKNFNIFSYIFINLDFVFVLRLYIVFNVLFIFISKSSGGVKKLLVILITSLSNLFIIISLSN